MTAFGLHRSVRPLEGDFWRSTAFQVRLGRNRSAYQMASGRHSSGTRVAQTVSGKELRQRVSP